MSRLRPLHHNPLRSLPGVLLLALALLWAQAMGLAHGVLHAHARQAAPATVQAQPAQDVLAHLLAPAGDDNQCRLYDQLGQGGPLLPVLAVAPALALPLVPAWVVLQALQSHPCAAFAARAPPTSR